MFNLPVHPHLPKHATGQMPSWPHNTWENVYFQGILSRASAARKHLALDPLVLYESNTYNLSI